MNSLVGLLAFGFMTGCSFTTHLSYESIPANLMDPIGSVTLSVVDARPSEYGGDGRALIGQVRGGFGNPFPLYETEAHRVVQLVRAATEEAMAHSRLLVHDGGPRTVVVTVTEFWVDGYLGYRANIEVQCTLRDRQGALLWSATIHGSAGGVAWVTPTGFVEATFQKALADYAEAAIAQFSSPKFQKHLD